MSDDRQWVELDPTNGAGAGKSQSPGRDVNADDKGKEAETPAPPPKGTD